MTDKQQIEEMAFDLVKATSPLGIKDLTKTFDYLTVATDLYNDWCWRKVPKNAVVLTKEEYKSINLDRAVDMLREIQNQAHKETAEKILKWLVDTGVINTAPDTIKMYFKEHFGVEAE